MKLMCIVNSEAALDCSIWHNYVELFLFSKYNTNLGNLDLKSKKKTKKQIRGQFQEKFL